MNLTLLGIVPDCSSSTYMSVDSYYLRGKKGLLRKNFCSVNVLWCIKGQHLNIRITIYFNQCALTW